MRWSRFFSRKGEDADTKKQKQQSEVRILILIFLSFIASDGVAYKNKITKHWTFSLTILIYTHTILFKLYRHASLIFRSMSYEKSLELHLLTQLLILAECLTCG